MASVLVVEDDRDIRDLISEALRDRGLPVDAVDGDVPAYGRIAALPTLDALIVDVHLGAGTTGFDIARFARKVIPDIAVVYVSGQVNRASFVSFGVPDSAFVEKPFKLDELVEAVTQTLAGAKRE